MAVEFKSGDIVITVPSLYTTVLVVHVQKSIMRPGYLFGKVVPMFGTFPIGSHLYEAEFPEEWKKINLTEKVITEAKRALTEAWQCKAVDNLTYVELLAGLNERTEPQ